MLLFWSEIGFNYVQISLLKRFDFFQNFIIYDIDIRDENRYTYISVIDDNGFMFFN